MKSVLLDSSVWVSYFSGDKNHGKAARMMDIFLHDGRRIIMPTLVYVEAINALHRLRINFNEIETAKNFLLNNNKINLCHTTSVFWLNEITNLMKSIDLRSHDLIIMAHALKYNAELISFDNKMNTAYIKISTIKNTQI